MSHPCLEGTKISDTGKILLMMKQRFFFERLHVATLWNLYKKKIKEGKILTFSFVSLQQQPDPQIFPGSGPGDGCFVHLRHQLPQNLPSPFLDRRSPAV